MASQMFANYEAIEEYSHRASRAGGRTH